MTGGCVLPGWLSDADVSMPADIPDVLENCMWSGALWQGARDVFRMDIPDAARVWVTTEGLRVSPQNGCDLHVLAPVLRRTPLAALCWMRGYYACQGVGLAGPDGAIVLLGASGTGKTALAVRLIQKSLEAGGGQGLRLLCDDLVPLGLDADGAVRVMPVWPELVLWSETVAAMFPAGLPGWLVRREGDLYDVPFWSVAPGRFQDAPAVLKKVYILKRVRKDAEPEAQLTGGLNGFVTGEGGLTPYHPAVAYALRTQGQALQYYGAVTARAKIEIFKMPQADISELDVAADRIFADCGGYDHG